MQLWSSACLCDFFFLNWPLPSIKPPPFPWTIGLPDLLSSFTRLLEGQGSVLQLYFPSWTLHFGTNVAGFCAVFCNLRLGGLCCSAKIRNQFPLKSQLEAFTQSSYPRPNAYYQLPLLHQCGHEENSYAYIMNAVEVITIIIQPASRTGTLAAKTEINLCT